MLGTVRILLLNPDLQIVYLVIGNGFRIRSQVPGQTALKLLEEEKIDLILLHPAVPLPTDEQDRGTGASRLTFEAQSKKREVMTGKSNRLLTLL